jgi:asparagine synthase (glutamine-hydrolysing)
MCGLTGFWSPEGGEESAMRFTAAGMADTLVHRGPDDAGTWVDGDTGVALAFRRLSILDLSPTGHQPMCSADGRFVVVFNGEIYNFLDLREELESLGDRFRGRSDTEVMLAGFVRWGVGETLRRMAGMFALALWDRRERTLVLARDRIGKKPLYYTQGDLPFLFGSELKALHAHPSFRPELDREALALYVRHGYVPSPHSIYRGVSKLAPGHFLTARSGRPEASVPFWDVRHVVSNGLSHPLELSQEEALEALEDLLSDSVGRRMIADVPLGALLSGGVDSSVVVALMQARSSRPIRTFTIGFSIREFNEADDARAVAEHLGTDHTELYVSAQEAQEVIPRLPDLYDEPFADSSQIPTYLVCALARKSVTVSLSGDGGDELFGGYSRYLWAESIWRVLRGTPVSLRALGSRVIGLAGPARWDHIYKNLESLLPRSRRVSQPGEKLHKLAALLSADDPDELYLRLVSLWKRPEKVVVGAREPSTALRDPSHRDLVPDFTQRMMFRDLVSYLPDDILTKVDRASMGVSLEVRCPLLDHRLVEWAWSLPLSLKRRRGVSKWLLRQLLYRYVPRPMVDRPKTGFGIPVGAWLRGPLRDWAEDLLGEARLARESVFDPSPIRAAWSEHLAGRSNEQYRLWAILMFQAWRARWRA